MTGSLADGSHASSRFCGRKTEVIAGHRAGDDFHPLGRGHQWRLEGCRPCVAAVSPYGPSWRLLAASCFWTRSRSRRLAPASRTNASQSSLCAQDHRVEVTACSLAGPLDSSIRQRSSIPAWRGIGSGTVGLLVEVCCEGRQIAAIAFAPLFGCSNLAWASGP